MLPAELRERAKKVRDAARRLVRATTHQLADRAAILMREAEAAVAVLRETMQQMAQRRSDGEPEGVWTAEQFETDSRECLKESSPTPQMAAYGVRSEQIYRGCLRARGWIRAEKDANYSPPGW
jgi:hypothetical protein